ncbi:MAG TPA: S46 family peptidase, partial [Rikenellaceae bacterium]|nr:S46 family peptidase [Rikenellaceae bacterium]
MRNLIKVTTLFTLLLILTPSRADEGMWLINLLDKNLTSKMRAAGLKIDPKIIYDENTASLSDAVVALDFGCTGSIISKDGLLITNHHCAYGDVHALSTPNKNYLEDGFWAMKRDQEIYINGKSVFFLRKVMDVSDEVKRVSDSLKTAGQPSGMRRISSVMEGAASKKSGMESML